VATLDSIHVHSRIERVLIETVRHRITGSLTLPRDGYRSRVSDFLNANEREFISLTDVTIETITGDVADSHHDFVTVSRNHIVLATQVAGAPVE
jgi:hypothetical protein